MFVVSGNYATKWGGGTTTINPVTRFISTAGFDSLEVAG